MHDDIIIYLTNLLAGVKAKNVISARWQVTLCDTSLAVRAIGHWALFVFCDSSCFGSAVAIYVNIVHCSNSRHF